MKLNVKVFLIVNKTIKSIFEGNSYLMKLYLFVFSIVFNLFSCSESIKKQTPNDVLESAFEQINSWETLSFKAETTYSDKSKTPLSTVYNLKRVNYEPHLKLFFSKQMNQEITIYYKLASLVVSVMVPISPITAFNTSSAVALPSVKLLKTS